MELPVCLLTGYLVGCVNPSYLIARRKGFDIRRRGSGNAGGSNALITMGKGIGAVCMVFDIVKAYGIIRLMEWLFSDGAYVFSATAAACVLGHLFPFYMRFQGGKGLACIAGATLAYSPAVFLAMLLAEAVLAFSSDYLCLVPISAAAALPALYAKATKDAIGTLMLSAAGIAVIAKHLKNLRRIKDGTEAHLSYLWNRDEELEHQRRIRGITDKNATEETLDITM